MIVSVSRRTDIPALYHEWFFHRLQAGEVFVKNPFNPRRIRRISLKREDVTGFVFWTRDASPFLSRLDELQGYEYVFLVTLNAYGEDLEPASFEELPAVETIKRLSARIGKENVVWRYDPIILTDRYDETFHLEAFERLAEALSPHVKKAVTSFVTTYRKNKRAFRHFGVKDVDERTKRHLAERLGDIAKREGLRLEICGEALDLEKEGLPSARCISGVYFRKGDTLPEDKNQRETCNCVESVDIGMYDTCTHGCLYCYAAGREETVHKNRNRHSPCHPSLL